MVRRRGSGKSPWLQLAFLTLLSSIFLLVSIFLANVLLAETKQLLEEQSIGNEFL